MILKKKTTLAPKIWPAAFVLGGLISLVAAVPVLAQNGVGSAPKSAPSGPVTVELKAFKVVREESGKEQFLDATRARPGDVLEYRATYANLSTKEVKNLQANLPIPAATELIPASIAPKPVLASANKRTFAAMPLMQIVRTPAGDSQRPMPLSAYRALRWPLGTLAAGQSITVRARVRLYNTFTPSN